MTPITDAHYGDALLAISQAAQKAVEGFVAQLGIDAPAASRDALLAVMRATADQYGNAAAAVAAELWEQRMGTRAKLVGADLPRVASSTRRLAGALWDGEPGDMLPGLCAALDKAVRRAAHQTLVASGGG